MLFLILRIERKTLAENLTNLAETLKIVGPRGVHGAPLFQLQGPLALGGARAPPSATWSGGQDCRGKVKCQGLVEHCRLIITAGWHYTGMIGCWCPQGANIGIWEYLS